MKTDIHPNYQEITTTCSCGNVLPVMSTLKDNLSLDVCAKCHPFYTGKQKMLDSGGRVKKFQDRFGAGGASKPAAKKAEAKVEETAVEEAAEEAAGNRSAQGETGQRCGAPAQPAPKARGRGRPAGPAGGDIELVQRERLAWAPRGRAQPKSWPRGQKWYPRANAGLHT